LLSTYKISIIENFPFVNRLIRKFYIIFVRFFEEEKKMSLLDRIKSLASTHQLSLAELERKLDFSNGSLRKWDSSTPSGDKIEKVADYFNVSTDFLLGRTENPSIADDNREYIWQGKTLNVEEMASNVMMFGGRELTDEKKKIIQSIIEGYLKEAGD
jgi:raw score 17.76